MNKKEEKQLNYHNKINSILSNLYYNIRFPIKRDYDTTLEKLFYPILTPINNTKSTIKREIVFSFINRD